MEEFITGALFSKLGREYVFKLATLDIKNIYAEYFSKTKENREEIVWRNLHASVRKVLYRSPDYQKVKDELESARINLLREIESNAYRELRSTSSVQPSTALASEFVEKALAISFESNKLTFYKEDVHKIAESFLELFIREEISLLRHVYNEVVKKQKEAASASETTVTVKEQLEIARRASDRMQELILIATESETKEKMEFYVDPDWYREIVFNLIGHDFSGFKGFPMKNLYNSDPEFIVLMVSYMAMANQTIKNSTHLPSSLPSWDSPTILYPEPGGFQRILAKDFLATFLNQVISPAIGIPYSEKNSITLKSLEHSLTRIEASKEVHVSTKEILNIMEPETRKAFLHLIRKDQRTREEEEILKAILYPIVPLSRISGDMMGSWGQVDNLINYVLPEPQVLTSDSVNIYRWLDDKSLIAFSTLGGASSMIDHGDVLAYFLEKFNGVNVDIFKALGKSKPADMTPASVSFSSYRLEEIFRKYPRQLFCLLEHPFHSRMLHETLATGENPQYLIESIINYMVLKDLSRKNPNILMVINRSELPLVFAIKIGGDRYVETYMQTYSAFGNSPANNRFIKVVHPMDVTNQVFYGFTDTMAMLPPTRKPYRNYVWEAHVSNISHLDLMCFEAFRRQLTIDKILEKARTGKITFQETMNTELLSDGIDDTNYRRKTMIATGIDYEKSTDDIWNPFLWVNSGLLELIVKETEMAVRIVKAVDSLYHKAGQRQAEPIREREEQLREMRKVLQIFISVEYSQDMQGYVRLLDSIINAAESQRKNAEEAALASAGGVWPNVKIQEASLNSAMTFSEERLAMIKQIKNIIVKNQKELEKLQDQIVL